MWDLGNRGVFVLISVLSGCVFVYNAWGPILTVAISLLLVVYACYSLLVYDSILSPQTILVLKYLKEAGRELREALQNAGIYFVRKVRELSHFFKNLYQSRFVLKMSRYRRSSYQLSNDSYIGTRDSSRFNLTGTLSPIPRSTYQPFVDDSGRENSSYGDQNNLTYNKGSVGKYTSTPLVPWKKEIPSNGGLGLLTPNRSPRKKTMPINAQSHTLSRARDTVFSPEGSPWGTSISPKMRAKAGGVKTVQTIAGPLLASTRCNIDPKVYADVTSPGLSTRLTKYATEANNKLTHQSQYATGQFPKVNLSTSPMPLIIAKSTKMRTPVTVRIAPPDANRYLPSEKQKILSEICHLENRATMPNVVQVLREISLKRHASQEDITSELIKKQRTDGTFSDDLETLEEMTQKRPRDDSSKSEEDISPQKRILRPTKRSKIPSCYDVLNSFSSSIHVPSGVKRKAMDSSRSGTPDHEKHFKLSDSIQIVSLPVLPQPQIEIPIPNKRGLSEELSSDINVLNPRKKIQDHIPPKGILKSTFSKESIANQDLVEPEGKHVNKKDTKLHVIKKESPMINKPENLTDKLFMRAEPQSNEKLKTLIQEQGNIKAKFTTEDVEEIRKEDIVNMRQTSMRARLQSMFDAISGKAASEINPNVVIQAEEIKTPISVAASPTILTTLNSSTSTTNINTSPIATSAIVPNIIKSKSNVTPTKHVTFTLANTESSQKPNSSTNVSTVRPKVENFASTKYEAKLNLTVTTSSTSLAVTSNSPSSSSSFTASKSNTVTPSFNFGSVSSSTTASFLPNTTLTFGTPTMSAAISLPSNVVSTSTTQPVIQAAANITSNSAPVPTNSISSVVTSSSNNFVYDLNKTTEKSVTKTPIPSNFSFGSVTTNTASTLINTQTTTSSSTQKQTITSSPSFGIPSTVPTTSSVGSINSVTSSVKNSTFNVTSTSNLATTTASSLFSFGTNIATPQISKSEDFSFGSSATTVQKAPTFENTTATTQAIPLFGSATTTASFAFPTSSSTSITTTVPSFNTTAIASNTTTITKFGSPVTTSSFLFGTTSALPTSIIKSGFSFGTNTTTTTTTTSNPSNSTITFGTSSSNSTPAFGTTTSNAIPTFGATGSNATPSFGTTGSNATPIFGTTGNNATSTFGTPSTTAVQSFGTTTTAPIFGSTTSAPLFGAAKSQLAFGGTPSQETTNIFRTPNTTAPPAFGSNTGTTAFGVTGTTPSLFSGASTNVNTAAAAPAPAAALPAESGTIMRAISFCHAFRKTTATAVRSTKPGDFDDLVLLEQESE